MFPKWHIILGAIFAYILIQFFNFSLTAGLVVFLASFLIDVDHYLIYVIKKKNLSLEKAYNYFADKRKKISKLKGKARQKAKQDDVIIFHGIEFWAILIILSFFHPVFLWILLGIAIHMIADFADMIYYKDPISSKLSQIYVWSKLKKN